MTDQSRPEHVAVVCSPQGDDAAAMRDFLKTHNLADAEWYSPRDADEMDQAVRAGRVQRVIFPRVTGFLDAVWSEMITFDAQFADAAQIEFLEARPPHTQAAMQVVLESWRLWQRRHRRRQVVAGAILSAAALAAAFTLLLMLR